MEIVKQIAQSLEAGDDALVPQLTREALAQGIAATAILDDGLIAGMNAVGEKFRVHDIFLPDVLLAARAMYAGMDVLKPLLLSAGIPSRGRVVIGSVHGDLHDIGKNLVGIMLKGAGFDVIDLGNDVTAARFVEAARSREALVIGMSALLTTTMPVMKEVVDLLHKEGLGGRIKTIIGGAPVSQDYAAEIGADAYGYDCAQAVERVKQLAASAS
ncbi:MAG: corrinoid protein [Acidobacteria bacterium]|jgi:5-methyltetrahydrofolate--homocysteine methyltransferase|nr:corrinoid protein [Acidobacteriota bacterium]